MALNEFEGTVMLVSHDRALLREVRRVLAGRRGGAQPFDGDLDDYQRWLLAEAGKRLKTVAAEDIERLEAAGSS